MGWFHSEGNERDRKLESRMRIICRWVFILMLLLMLTVYLIFRFSSVKAGCSKVVGYVRGVIFGLIIAYIIEPVCAAIERFFLRFLKNRKYGPQTAKWLGIILGLLAFVGVIAGILWAIIPGTIDSIGTIVNSIPDYARTIQTFIETHITKHPNVAETLSSFVDSALDSLQSWMSSGMKNLANEVVTKITTGVVNVVKFVADLLIGLIASVYVLRDKKRIVNQLKKAVYALFNLAHADDILDTIREGHHIFGDFIHGKILDSLIIGILCMIGTSILRIPYSLLISVIVGVTNLIPFFGPLIGAVPSALLVLVVSPIKCLQFIIFIIILQQLDGNVIGPHIVGHRTGINEFWVTFSLLLFGGIFGFFGMLIGVPLFGLIYFIIVKLMNRHLAKKGLPTASDDYAGVSDYSQIQVKEKSEEAEAKSPEPEPEPKDKPDQEN